MLYGAIYMIYRAIYTHYISIPMIYRAMYTPREIIGCLKDVFVGIEEASGSEGLDDLFPLLVMTVVRAE